MRPYLGMILLQKKVLILVFFPLRDPVKSLPFKLKITFPLRSEGKEGLDFNFLSNLKVAATTSKRSHDTTSLWRRGNSGLKDTESNKF